VTTEKEQCDRDGAVAVGGAVIMTRDAYARSIGYEPDGKPLTLVARFDQGRWWKTRKGEWFRITDMQPGHRYNTAAMLMRGAEVHAFRYATNFAVEVDRHDGGEMAHDALERLSDDLLRRGKTDPRGWLRATGLYKALTAGLVIQGDGTKPWQATGCDPVTGERVEVPPRTSRVCEIPACGCSGEAHA
jgi:hypothetical protein